MLLCVWQAVHLNIPTPGEPSNKQILRRMLWSLLAILAPELVALNAWAQYRSARSLMRRVNDLRKTPPSSHSFWRRSGNMASIALVALLGVPDRLRMRFCHYNEAKRNESEERQRTIDSRHVELQEDKLPWTIETAFYAVSNGCVLTNHLGMGDILNAKGIEYLAENYPQCLIPVQSTVLQDPGKATGLAKLITCAQALWFCSQCIARLSQDMAISLLELNTFAHCISAFFIYAFWWHKPYDVGTHVYIDNPELYHASLLDRATHGLRRQMGQQFHEVHVMTAHDVAGCSYLIKTIPPWGTPEIWSPSARNFHRITTGELIPGTGFVLKSAADDGEKVFFLPIGTLTYWTRLWALMPDSRFSIRREDPWTKHTTVLHASDWDDSFWNRSFDDKGAFLVQLVMIVIFFIYGGVHLLAWQYNFQTAAESILWRTAAIATTASGLLVVLISFDAYLEEHSLNSIAWTVFLFFSVWPLCIADLAARAFLIAECFKALPNSPASVYEVPGWTAYIPHV